MLASAVRGSVWVLAVLVALPAATRGGAAAPPAGGAPPADFTYVVRLSRPFCVGEKFAYTADGTLIQTLTVNNAGQIKTFQPRSISVHFEGTEEILAVNPRGEPTKAAYTVAECTSREGKQQLIVIPPGRVVTVEAGKWKPRIDVDQGAFTIQDEFVVRAVLSLPNTGQASDDECFGSDQARKVGESWPARPDGLVKSYAAAPGMKVKKQNVSGTIKLAGVETVDGVMCLKVQGKTKVEHFFPPAIDLPDRSKVQDATFEYKFTRFLPVDQVGQCLVDSHSTNVQLKLRMDDATIGSEIPVDGKLLRTVGIKRKPVR